MLKRILFQISKVGGVNQFVLSISTKTEKHCNTSPKRSRCSLAQNVPKTASNWLAATFYSRSSVRNWQVFSLQNMFRGLTRYLKTVRIDSRPSKAPPADLTDGIGWGISCTELIFGYRNAAARCRLIFSYRVSRRNIWV